MNELRDYRGEFLEHKKPKPTKHRKVSIDAETQKW